MPTSRENRNQKIHVLTFLSLCCTHRQHAKPSSSEPPAFLLNSRNRLSPATMSQKQPSCPFGGTIWGFRVKAWASVTELCRFLFLTTTDWSVYLPYLLIRTVRYYETLAAVHRQGHLELWPALVHLLRLSLQSRWQLHLLLLLEGW